ncbi:unnamed protein product [Amoebophrya sp. A25]|nr:unnamed protein product [Amoebophrya sp. A25]|eukprot:GSA25T00018662001.1
MLKDKVHADDDVQRLQKRRSCKRRVWWASKAVSIGQAEGDEHEDPQELVSLVDGEGDDDWR